MSESAKKRHLRICLAASAGGHTSQLLKLADSWNGYETFCVTTTQVVRDKLSKSGEVYVVGECNRQHPIRVITVLLRCCRIVFKKRPDVVISTGAAAGCITRRKSRMDRQYYQCGTNLFVGKNGSLYCGFIPGAMA
jgi:hypothetical protein